MYQSNACYYHNNIWLYKPQLVYHEFVHKIEVNKTNLMIVVCIVNCACYIMWGGEAVPVIKHPPFLEYSTI